MEQVGIRLIDGSVIKAPSWEAVETDWSVDFMNQISSPEGFRTDIQNRAKLWSGIDIQISGSSYDFLAECERAGLVQTIQNASQSYDGPPIVPISRKVFLTLCQERMSRRRSKKGRLSAAPTS